MLRTEYLLACLLFYVLYYEQPEDTRIENNLDCKILVDKDNVALNPYDIIFPVERFKKKDIWSYDETDLAESFSMYMYIFREPVLVKKKTRKEIFRFMCIPAFNPAFLVGIIKEDSSVMVYWKKSNSVLNDFNNNFLKTSKLEFYKEKQLSLEQWEQFSSLINKSYFWFLQTCSKFGEVYLDGNLYLLEAVDSSRYHVISRWSIDLNSPMHQAVMFLLNQTDLKIRNEDIF